MNTTSFASQPISWENRISGVSVPLWAVAYGNNTFVAAGEVGTIVTSTDGIEWTIRDSGITDYIFDVAFANDLFVAVGGIPYNFSMILTSPDGVTWTPRDPTTTHLLGSVVYGNGRWVAVGAQGVAVTSTDGITWEEHPTGSSSLLRRVTFAEGQFVAVGGSPYLQQPGTIVTSADGESWTIQDPGTTEALRDVAYANGTYVVVGVSGITLVSSGAVSWTPRPSNQENDFWAVTQGGTHFAAVGINGTLLTRPYGVHDWTSHETSTSNTLLDISYGQGHYSTEEGVTLNVGTYVAVGEQGIILTASTSYSNRLSLQATDQGIEVSWPDEGLPFKLQYSESLDFPTIWHSVSNTEIQSTDGIHRSIFPLDGKAMFYRLNATNSELTP